MRFIFLNPQKSAFFGATVLNHFSRIHSTIRYKYLIDYFSSHHQLHLFVTPASSSLPEYLSRYFPIRLEIFIWAIINHLNPFQIKIITKLEDLSSSDILFSQTLRTFDHNIAIPIPPNHRFLTLFHITHYNNFTSSLAKNLKPLSPDILIAENNLFKNSPYFRKHFSFYKKNVYVLPYVYEKRFHSYLPFNQRVNKCLSTGSVVVTKDLNDSGQFKDFNDYYHVDSLTPLRKIIMDNKDKIISKIDTITSKVFEHQPKYPSPQDNFIVKLYKSIYNGISISRIKYFKFNIVDKYNQYCMFTVPEELSLPSVGFVEGMACGSAYVGLNDPMYTDIGLVPGIHYIGYDGTLKDMLAKIGYYQTHPTKLATIAKNGHDYVTKHFNGDSVAKTFYQDIKKLARHRQLPTTSSFSLH